MKIQYISQHSVLEYDEVKLLTELGFDVQSNGVYRDPRGAHTLPRPGIEGIEFDQTFFDLTANHPKTDMPPELIEPYDVIIIMAGQNEAVLVNNWDRMKHKRVIWRTIGQSTAATERRVKRMRDEGLEIIRYSPKEQNIQDYVGGDEIIRFYKDPEEFTNWNGNQKTVINFSQSLKGRRNHCHYDEITASMVGFDSKIYGTGNDDLGPLNGGEVTYNRMKQLMRDSRVFVYGGTWPASYTLSFIEALMTGIPIVGISKAMAHIPRYENIDFYEVDEIIRCFDTVTEMRQDIQRLLDDYNYAFETSKVQREKAIELFGKEKIAKQWSDFLRKA